MNYLITYSCIEETKAYWYAWNVVEKNIVACEDVYNACTRFMNDLEKSEKEEYPFYFDLEMMAKIENVASCFKFTSGARAGDRIELAPHKVLYLEIFIVGDLKIIRKNVDLDLYS